MTWVLASPEGQAAFEGGDRGGDAARGKSYIRTFHRQEDGEDGEDGRVRVFEINGDNGSLLTFKETDNGKVRVLINSGKALAISDVSPRQLRAALASLVKGTPPEDAIREDAPSEPDSTPKATEDPEPPATAPATVEPAAKSAQRAIKPAPKPSAAKSSAAKSSAAKRPRRVPAVINPTDAQMNDL